MSELAITRKIEGIISENEARAAFEKAATQFAKTKVNEAGQIVFRPKSAIHRLKVSASVEPNENGTTIVTFTGDIGFSLMMGLIAVPLIIVLTTTVIGLIFAIVMVIWSKKIASNTFKETAENAFVLM